MLNRVVEEMDHYFDHTHLKRRRTDYGLFLAYPVCEKATAWQGTEFIDRSRRSGEWGTWSNSNV